MKFEDTRYNRQELMPQMGLIAQEKLKQAKVVVIGAGGVKSPLLYYLAATGVGTICIYDFDKVELSNLNRQILFDIDDIGKNKATIACEKLKRLNPEIEIKAKDLKITPDNIDEELCGFDIIVEGGDSLEGRQLVNLFSLKAGIPMVHASAQYNYGYCLTVIPSEKTSCFDCIFPDLPEREGLGSVPVMGISTGIAGTLGACEVIKIITGTGKTMTNGFLTFSGFQSRFEFFSIKRNPRCKTCGNISN
jgi:molybdopterin/thiamine biosynthesis adenylyltransferase